jgi:diaminohydroxyphosphoribosylaminopyrimidine deaminase/5-amino-6-(5-phosphoribosylamino)uracil reductase
MHRCLNLARLAAGDVLPNPMVGAVLVHEGRIIGEGYHRKYGTSHAEANCINSVKEGDRSLIVKSTLYVSLEPCAHFGKTPPCADLVIRHHIPRVVIGCRDPFKEVDGKGIEKLKAAGVVVELGTLEDECKELNKRFLLFHTQLRPYIILKWAQTADEKIASANDSRLLISNEYSNRLVHKWRSEEAGILIGTTTALVDNPSLTTRHWTGRSAMRLVLDMGLRLPATLNVFDDTARTIIFNSIKQEESQNIFYYKLSKQGSIITGLMKALYELNIQSILVEGGAKLLQSFIDEGLWDEARVISNTKLTLADAGVRSPLLKNAIRLHEMQLENDCIAFYKQKE